MGVEGLLIRGKGLRAFHPAQAGHENGGRMTLNKVEVAFLIWSAVTQAFVVVMARSYREARRKVR